MQRFLNVCTYQGLRGRAHDRQWTADVVWYVPQRYTQNSGENISIDVSQCINNVIL